MEEQKNQEQTVSSFEMKTKYSRIENVWKKMFLRNLENTILIQIRDSI